MKAPKTYIYLIGYNGTIIRNIPTDETDYYKLDAIAEKIILKEYGIGAFNTGVVSYRYVKNSNWE